MTPEQIAALADSMCMTWRHDFGLDKPEPTGNWTDAMTSGMTASEREALRRNMRQLIEHHFLPEFTKSAIKSNLITAQMNLNAELQARITELQSDLTAAQCRMEGQAAEISTMKRLLEIGEEDESVVCFFCGSSVNGPHDADCPQNNSIESGQ